MKVGDTVKVLAIRGNPHTNPPGQDVWIMGKVLGTRDIAPPVSITVYKVGFGEFSSYQEKEFERHEMKLYQPQTDEQFQEDIDRDMPIGLALAKEAMASLKPGDATPIVLKDGELSYHGIVTITPVQYDHPRIGGLIEKTGYEVITWECKHATRWHPEEYIDSPVGTFPTIGLAVKAMIEAIFKANSNAYWNSKADQAMAEALEQEEAYP